MLDDSDITFEQFASDYRKSFLRYAVAQCGEWHAAEDITQETLDHHAPTLVRHRTEGPVGLRADSDRALDHARRMAAQKLKVPDNCSMNYQILMRIAEKENIGEGVASRLAVRQALGQLPDRQRQAIHLRYWRGLSTSEIAHALRVPAGTVRSRSLARATARLRRVLAAAFHGAHKRNVRS